MSWRFPSNIFDRFTGVVFLVLLLMGTSPTLALSSPSSPLPEGPPERNPSFTLSRIRLYVIHARQGEARVLLPPLDGHHPTAVINEAVDSAVKAIDRIRRRYPNYADLELVSQAPYLLQLVRVKSSGYRYQLSPEQGGVSYSAGAFDGALSASTRDGQLTIEVSVQREEEQVFQISLQLTPGRSLVFGQDLPNGDALFAVLTVNAPDSTPHPTPSLQNEQEGQTDDRIHTSWDTPPRLVHSTQLAYPDIARRAGVEGTVTLYVVIGTDGKVEEVEAAYSTPSKIFNEAAEQAIKQWRYEPAKVDGKPVRARCSQTLRFVLSDRGGPFF